MQSKKPENAQAPNSGQQVCTAIRHSAAPGPVHVADKKVRH
jgi:hypothetical protein